MNAGCVLTVVTDRGRVREHNEDAVGIDGWTLYGETAGVLRFHLDPGSRVVVCDGMGGHLAGEVASRMAAELLTAPFDLWNADESDGVSMNAVTGEESVTAEEDTLESLLTARVQAVADQIVTLGDTEPTLRGMGTTAAGIVLLDDGDVLAYNVGDSTVLECHGGTPTVLSVPDVGFGGGLTQALGAVHVTLTVHTRHVPAEPGAAVLMCSDGLTDLVADEVIAKALDSGDDDADIARSLVDLACELGGHDNITLAILRFPK